MDGRCRQFAKIAQPRLGVEPRGLHLPGCESRPVPPDPPLHRALPRPAQIGHEDMEPFGPQRLGQGRP